MKAFIKRILRRIKQKWCKHDYQYMRSVHGTQLDDWVFKDIHACAKCEKKSEVTAYDLKNVVSVEVETERPKSSGLRFSPEVEVKVMSYDKDFFKELTNRDPILKRIGGNRHDEKTNKHD